MHLKEMTLAGELGRINYIYSHRLNLGKIRREENILWSFAPHDISMILALAGEQPESVLATGGNYLHQKIADVMVNSFAVDSTAEWDGKTLVMYTFSNDEGDKPEYT